jgi:ABC-type transport system involved in multi-copper enzyme maturation permease subunit
MRLLTGFWLKQQMKQGRLLVIYILSIILFFISGMIYSGRFEENLKTQSEWERNAQNRIGAVSTPDEAIGRSFSCYMRYSSLRFIADNNLEGVPTYRWVMANRVGVPDTAGYRKQETHGLWDIDVIFLVSVVFSFLSVVITFDAICGEKERGTLKLLLSTGISRTKIVMSKIIASTLVLAIPLIVGLLIQVTLMSFKSAFELSLGNLAVLLLVVVYSILVLLFFVAMGVTISSLTRSSITSLVILLLLWVSFVVVIPGLAKPVSKEFVKIDTPEELAKQRDRLEDDFMNKMMKSGAVDRPRELAMADDFKGERIWNRIMGEKNSDEQNINDEQLRKMILQAEASRAFARISPVMIYKIALSNIAATDLQTVLDFNDQTLRYQQVIKTFVKDQDSKDPESPHLLNSDGRGYLSIKPLESEVPGFTYEAPDVTSRFFDSLFDIVILFALAMSLVMTSVIAINRYDVR